MEDATDRLQEALCEATSVAGVRAAYAEAIRSAPREDAQTYVIWQSLRNERLDELACGAIRPADEDEHDDSPRRWMGAFAAGADKETLQAWLREIPPVREDMLRRMRALLSAHEEWSDFQRAGDVPVHTVQILRHWFTRGDDAGAHAALRHGEGAAQGLEAIQRRRHLAAAVAPLLRDQAPVRVLPEPELEHATTPPPAPPPPAPPTAPREPAPAPLAPAPQRRGPRRPRSETPTTKGGSIGYWWVFLLIWIPVKLCRHLTKDEAPPSVPAFEFEEYRGWEDRLRDLRNRNPDGTDLEDVERSLQDIDTEQLEGDGREALERLRERIRRLREEDGR